MGFFQRRAEQRAGRKLEVQKRAVVDAGFRVRKAADDRFFGDVVPGKSAMLGDDPGGWMKAYKLCVWVRRCIDLRATNIANTPLKLYQTDSDGKPQEITEHPSLSLLKKPNPFDVRSGSALWQLTEIDTQVSGDAYWYIETFGGEVPKELYRIPTHLMTPVPSREKGKFIDHYEYTPNTKTVEKIQYPAERIIHFRIANPADSYNGLSPTQSVMSKVNLLLESDNWNSRFFANNARMDGYITFPEQLDPEDVNLARQTIELMHQSSDNWHRVGVLGAGGVFKESSVAPKDADWSTSQDKGRDAVCAGYGVPVFLVSGHDAAYFATAEQQKLSFWEETLIPELGWYAGTLTAEFLPMFPRTENLFFGFDLSEVEALQPRMVIRQDRLAKATGQPVMLINEARKILGLDPLAGGDVLYIPVNMIAIGSNTVLIRTPDEEKGPL